MLRFVIRVNVKGPRFANHFCCSVIRQRVLPSGLLPIGSQYIGKKINKTYTVYTISGRPFWWTTIIIQSFRAWGNNWEFWWSLLALTTQLNPQPAITRFLFLFFGSTMRADHHLFCWSNMMACFYFYFILFFTLLADFAAPPPPCSHIAIIIICINWIEHSNLHRWI